jgi:cell division protein FtsX
LRDPLYVRLPFEERRFGLMLAALLSITLYGSFLAIGVSGVLGHAASGMDREMARRITFEVLPDPGKPGDVESKQERVKALAEKLSEVEGVEKVTHLPEEKMNALLAPWLGREKAPTDLPLPALIDVELKEPSPQIKEALAKAAAGVQGVMMDDHVAFEGALFRSVRGLQFTALYVLALGFAALLLTAAFAAETHFHINRNTIEILHLIGARDSAIARHMGLAGSRRDQRLYPRPAHAVCPFRFHAGIGSFSLPQFLAGPWRVSGHCYEMDYGRHFGHYALLCRRPYQCAARPFPHDLKNRVTSGGRRVKLPPWFSVPATPCSMD